MKKHILISVAGVSILFFMTQLSRASAFEDLSLHFSSFGFDEIQTVYVSTPVPSQDEQAAESSLGTDTGGDINVLNTQQVPLGLEILPDDDIREDSPMAEAILPMAYKPANGSTKIMGGSYMDTQNIIPADLKAAALAYYNANKDKIGNLRYFGVLDFSKHSSQARFYIADTVSGAVKVIHVSHGSGSDPDGDGYATRFSNTPNSNASSLGYYITGDVYYGKHGRALNLHGMSPTNYNALNRAVVIHSASYVSDYNTQAGRSWGCPAVSPNEIDSVITMLKDGALIYAGLSGVR